MPSTIVSQLGMNSTPAMDTRPCVDGVSHDASAATTTTLSSSPLKKCAQLPALSSLHHLIISFPVPPLTLQSLIHSLRLPLRPKNQSSKNHMPIFTPNHVHLIEACYPPSSTLLSAAPEYSPNAQELSRLLYYAANRPGKINKLGGELEKRVRLECYKTQSGNARVRAYVLSPFKQ